MQLYGFADADERRLFEQLLAVNGVGPKVALAIVSGYTPGELQRAIVREDAALFETIPGIGRKTAQRVVLELKEKIAPLAAVEQAPHLGGGGRPHRRARRARRARLHGGRGRAAPRRDRSRPAAGRARPAGAPGGMSAERVTAAAVLAPEEDELERLAPSAQPGRVRRPGAGQGAARDLARGREGARRGPRPRAPRRPARARQDEPRLHRPRGARRRHPHRRRPRARAEGRHGRDPDLARGARRPLRRRDPPAEPRRRGDPLPGARGLPARHRRRPGPGRAHADARPAAVHARRRDDAHGPSDDAASRPLRDHVPARALHARGAGADRAPLGPDPRRRDRGRGGGGDRAAGARHAAGREPDPAARPRRGRGAPRRRGHARSRARGARAPRGRRAGPRADRPLAARRDRA